MVPHPLAGGRVGYVFKKLLEEKRAGPSVGETFRDCPECPDMVVVPAGEFMMGSPESEKERWEDWEDWEGPVHRVSVRQPFAIGKYEVTRGQYSEFARTLGPRGLMVSGCWVNTGNEWEFERMSDWRSPGYSQTDEDPVVCISHEDAKDYTAWLSRETGHSYRLPSEAEWEYAARANTRSARYWGASADRACRYENVHDRTSLRVNKFQWTSHDCEDGYAQTSPVGKFGANAFGLYDMLGNVREWTEDCWNESYAGAPPNTNVRATGECSRFVVRGGSWNYNPRVARSAFRDWSGSDYRTDHNGFRVARVLQ